MSWLAPPTSSRSWKPHLEDEIWGLDITPFLVALSFPCMLFSLFSLLHLLSFSLSRQEGYNSCATQVWTSVRETPKNNVWKRQTNFLDLRGVKAMYCAYLFLAERLQAKISTRKGSLSFFFLFVFAVFSSPLAHMCVFKGAEQSPKTSSDNRPSLSQWVSLFPPEKLLLLSTTELQGGKHCYKNWL